MSIDDSKLAEQLQQNEEHHKQQMIQLETVSMMTKYQMVFTKMDSSLSKIGATISLRNLKSKYHAFTKIKQISKSRKLANQLEALRIYQHMDGKLKNLFNVLQDKALVSIFNGFCKIQIVAKTKNSENRYKEEQERQKREFLNKLNLKDEEIEKQKKKNEELEGILWQQKQRENDFQSKLSQKQKLIQRYESDLLEVKRQPQSTKNQENKITSGLSQMKELENNNALLNMQVQQNSMQLLNFVKEMNELLDSHSFILNEKNISSFRTKYKP
ncbi:hypothetical protein pb186bvf_011746 [Paramecium bursaria]